MHCELSKRGDNLFIGFDGALTFFKAKPGISSNLSSAEYGLGIPLLTSKKDLRQCLFQLL